MESLKKAVARFVEQFLKKVSVYVAVIVIFSYHVILNKDMPCTCKEQQQRDCALYMALPACLILVLMLWVDQTFQRVLKFICATRKRNFCCILLCHFFKAVFIGVLWPVSVLMDGDWYVCCCSTQQPDLACKNKTAITPEEQAAIAELKNKSLVTGLSILLIITLVAAIISPVQRSQCCCASKKKAAFDEIIFEEGETLIIEELRNAARNKITAKLQECVDNEEWEMCFDVAENLITDEPTTLDQGDEPPTSVQGDEPSASNQAAGSSTSDQAAGSSTSDQAAGSSTSDQAAGSSTSDQAAGSSTSDQAAESSTSDQAAGSSTSDQAAGSSTSDQAAGSSTFSNKWKFNFKPNRPNVGFRKQRSSHRSQINESSRLLPG